MLEFKTLNAEKIDDDCVLIKIKFENDIYIIWAHFSCERTCYRIDKNNNIDIFIMKNTKDASVEIVDQIHQALLYIKEKEEKKKERKKLLLQPCRAEIKAVQKQIDTAIAHY